MVPAAASTPPASSAKPAAGSRMAAVVTAAHQAAAAARTGTAARDDEVLGLFGIGYQAGEQIAAIPARKPGGDKPFQAAVQPGAQAALEAKPHTVAGEPLGITGGTAQ